MKPIILRILSLLTLFCLVGAGAVVQHKKFLGRDLTEPRTEKALPAAIEQLPDGAYAVNSASLCTDVQGYAGATPVCLVVKDGRIASVEALDNSETPSFYDRALEAVIPGYVGKTLDEAAALQVDGATGATYSSDALAANIRAAARYALETKLDQEASGGSAMKAWTWKSFIVLIVIFCAAIIPLFWHNKVYRIVQQLANVGVLGFWSGTFLSYTAFTGYIANGLQAASVVPVLLLIIAFVYPLFGLGTYYCSWVCPLGSLQDLAGHCSPVKIHIGRRTLQVLTWLRRILWFTLMAFLWFGIWFAWMDYELFIAFIVESAGWPLIGVALGFVVLSVFIPRPYCRFVCPTGTLFKLTNLDQ